MPSEKRNGLVSRLTIAFATGLCSLGMVGGASGASFQGLGTITGAWDQFASTVNGVSGDGRVVVGQANGIFDHGGESVSVLSQAFRWEAGTMQGLGIGVFPEHVTSTAHGASADGSVVVGSIELQVPGALQFHTDVLVYDSGTITTLPDVAGGPAVASGKDVSADGTLIVGTVNNAIGERAATWTGGVPTVVEAVYSYIERSSASGSEWVGSRINPAVKWTAGTAATLPLPPGALGGRVVTGISADGTTSVGYATFSAGKEAVRWVGGIGESLGDLPGGAVNARALDASADGSVIVGYGEDASGLSAFIWDATHGMRPLQDVLVNELGLDLTGWTLRRATGISDDGLTIVGSGPSPFDGGATRGFIAQLDPEPLPLFGGPALIVLCSALACGGGWLARRKMGDRSPPPATGLC